MFDGSYRDAGFEAGRYDDALPSGNAYADPVDFLHDLEGRLARSERRVEEEISRLNGRLSKLERAVENAAAGGALGDIRALEQKMVALSDRLAGLENARN